MTDRRRGDGDDAHDEETRPGEPREAEPEGSADRSGGGEPRTLPEGVRIIGAEEAQSALDTGAVQPRLVEGRRFGDVPPKPDPSKRPAVRFPLPADEPMTSHARVGGTRTEPDPSVSARPADPREAPTSEDVLGVSTGAGAQRDEGDDAGGHAGEVTGGEAGDVAGQPVSRWKEGVSVIAPEGRDPRGVDPPRGADRTAAGAEPDAHAGPAGDEAPDPDADAPEGDGLHEGDSSGPVQLPHWTEPPTGEIPTILADPSGEHLLDESDDPHARSPRFRTSASDWEHDDALADLSAGDASGSLGEEDASLGALSAQGDDPEADDEADFAAAVARRRRTGVRRPAARRAGRGASADAALAAGDAAGKASGRTVDTDRPAGSSDPSTRPHGDADRARTPSSTAPASAATSMSIRIVTGIAVAVIALICLELGRGATATLSTVIVGLAALELFEGMQRHKFRPATMLGVLACAVLVPIAYKRGEFAFPFVLAITLVFSLLWYLIGVVRARPLVNVGLTMLGVCYVGVLGGFVGLLLSFQDGIGMVLGLAICAVGSDVFGYFVGSWWGRTRLLPEISPNKTVEGLVGGMTASIVLAVLLVHQFAPWRDLSHALALGIVVAIAAPLGDMCESMLKRDLGVKDLGALLPGHGGVLDRFDGILFCLPAVYYLARALTIG